MTTRINALSRRVLAVCTKTPQTMNAILAKLPDEDKDKVVHRVHQLVTQGFLENREKVKSYGGLYALPATRRIKEPTLTSTSSFALYDVWC